ncbi:MAG: hypothetical protein ACE149_19110 [Armatimonadota bacterium]
MAQPFAVRRGWMRFMYAYTIVGAGGLGLGIVLAPERTGAVLGWPAGEPIALGVMGSVYVAFGLLSVLGLHDPLKFAPVLLLQLCYKSVWFAGVVLPLAAGGRFPSYGVPTAAIFATYIIGDLIAIPFRYLLARASGGQAAAA